MYSMIMLLTATTVIVAIFFNMKSVVKIRNNIFMGVTLPNEILESSLVENIKIEYKKISTKYLIVMIITSMPIFIIKKTSINITYLLVWSFICVGPIMSRPYIKINRRLKKLKQENNWFVGEKRVVLLDTKVSMLKNKMPISSKYFIIPMLLSVIPINISNANVDEFGFAPLIVAIIHFFINIGILFYVFRIFNKMKLKVYSENSDINYTINKEEKRMYSIFWTVIATIDSLSIILIYMEMFKYIDTNNWIIIACIFIITLPMILGFLYIREKISKLEEELRINDDKSILIDEDDYWINGMYYYNESDISTSVKARYGTSYTYNLATKSGRFMGKHLQWIVGSIVGIPIIILLLLFDFSPHSIDISIEKEEININCPLYNFKFDINDIEEISMLQEIPKASIKTNGASNSEYARGNFRLEEYGKSKVYVYYKNPYNILIKLNNSPVKYLVYNDKTYEKTEKVYEKLKDISENKD